MKDSFFEATIDRKPQADEIQAKYEGQFLPVDSIVYRGEVPLQYLGLRGVSFSRRSGDLAIVTGEESE